MLRYHSGWRAMALVVTTMLMALAITSCGEDDPIGPQEEHFEVIGVVVYSSGIQVASILRGVTNDTLRAPEGGRSDHLEVKFYDEDENIIDPPSDEDNSLSWEIEDTDIATVYQLAGEEGEFDFHLDGLKEGTTTIEFFVFHGDHSDFRSGRFPLVVEQDGNVEATFKPVTATVN